MIFVGDVNTIARTNIQPTEFKLKETSLYAFSDTIPVNDEFKLASFIVAGAGDLVDQTDLSSTSIVRPDETSSDALQEKVEVVMKVMGERLSCMGVGWDKVSSVNIYTTIPIHTLIVDSVLTPIGEASLNVVHWYYSNPPIKGLDYEMGVRCLAKELVIEL